MNFLTLLPLPHQIQLTIESLLHLISSVRKKNKTKQKSQFIRKPSTGKLKQWLPNSALSSSNPTKATLLPGEAALPGMRGTITTQDDGRVTFANLQASRGRRDPFSFEDEMDNSRLQHLWTIRIFKNTPGILILKLLLC